MFEVTEASIQRHRELLSEERTRGVELGKEWAMNVAEPGELEELRQHRDDGGKCDAVKLAELLEYDDPAAFWKSVVSQQEPSMWTVAGFVEGALEAWGQISEHLTTDENLHR